MRPELERHRLKSEEYPTEEQKKLLSGVSGEVIEIDGGVGIASEYLSKNGCSVTLQSEERLCFSYRNKEVPNSTVKQWNVSSDQISTNKKLFDYVIIRDALKTEMAKKIAKIGVVNLSTGEITSVIDTDVVDEEKPKTNRRAKSDE